MASSKRQKAAKPRVERVCEDCGRDFGLNGPLPYGHRVVAVRPRTVIRCKPAD